MEQDTYRLASRIGRVESLDAGGQLFNTDYIKWEEDRQEALQDLKEYAGEHDVVENGYVRSGVVLNPVYGRV